MPLLEARLGEWGTALLVTLCLFALLAAYAWLEPERLDRGG